MKRSHTEVKQNEDVNEAKRWENMHSRQPDTVMLTRICRCIWVTSSKVVLESHRKYYCEQLCLKSAYWLKLRFTNEYATPLAGNVMLDRVDRWMHRIFFGYSSVFHSEYFRCERNTQSEAEWNETLEIISSIFVTLFDSLAFTWMKILFHCRKSSISLELYKSCE